MFFAEFLWKIILHLRYIYVLMVAILLLIFLMAAPIVQYSPATSSSRSTNASCSPTDVPYPKVVEFCREERARSSTARTATPYRRTVSSSCAGSRRPGVWWLGSYKPFAACFRLPSVSVRRSRSSASSPLSVPVRFGKTTIFNRPHDGNIMSTETQKVLLMGMSAAGKTSIKSVIFSNCSPDDTKKLEQTVDVHTENVDFLDMQLMLWDCGGQTLYLGGYVDGSKPLMFHDVKVMVYVFDVENLDQELDRDYYFYLECLEALRKHSPSAKVYCLVHKIDLVRRAKRHSVFERRRAQLLKMSEPTECRCYTTSIYENSLYVAWSSIVCELVPDDVVEMERGEGPDQVLENDEI